MNDAEKLDRLPPTPRARLGGWMTITALHSSAKGLRFALSENHVKSAILYTVIFIITFVTSVKSTNLIDWPLFRAAAHALLSGSSPYHTSAIILGEPGYFYNPPWVLPILAPFAILPPLIGYSLWAGVSLCIYVYVVRRLSKSWLVLMLVLVFPFTYAPGIAGNIDALSALGLVLTPKIGLFFVFLKPQNTGIIAVFWLVQAWRKGGIMQVAVTFTPVTLAYLLSFALFGLWPLIDHPFVSAANMSRFPQLIPYGLALVVASIAFNKPMLAVLASPMFAPYYTHHTLMYFFLPVLFSAESVVKIIRERSGRLP